jgi:3',5'-cyclic AMP phosphodiesterase CpdA
MLRTQLEDYDQDGIDRRGFLKCMAWAGSGVIWAVQGGVPYSRALGQDLPHSKGEFRFVQISDTHIGFSRPANPDVSATLERAVEKINSAAEPGEFIIHTGDLTHSSRAEEFDTMDQILQQARPSQIFYVPGEHDVLGDGKRFLERYGRNAKGRGWHSFDYAGVHFVGLVNAGMESTLGKLGAEQLDWLERDLKGRSSSTPIVVFAHIPLWAVYPKWGWSTEDSEQALSYLRRFGSVTVLNGHIHQVMQKVEGRLTFHTAMSTAFPQPAPGAAAGPGPMVVPAETLRSVLGIARVYYHARGRRLALVDERLDGNDDSAVEIHR